MTVTKNDTEHQLAAVAGDGAAGSASAQLLDGVKRKLGRVPNMMQAMAVSPAVLTAYLRFSEALSASSLSVRLREQIGMLIAETNGCDYCLTAHHAVGQRAGLTLSELEQSRHGLSSDEKTTIALQFAKQVLARAGHVHESAVQTMRLAGYSDPEVLEVIACVALNVFTNFFNSVTEPEIDFPPMPVRVETVSP